MTPKYYEFELQRAEFKEGKRAQFLKLDKINCVDRFNQEPNTTGPIYLINLNAL